MKTLQRSHTCGELTAQHIGQQVVLNGWVGPRRDLGGLIFIDLRDRYGVTQIVFTETDATIHERAEQLGKNQDQRKAKQSKAKQRKQSNTK